MKNWFLLWVILLWPIVSVYGQEPVAALDYWQWRSPTPQGNDLSLVRQLNGSFFAGGESGSLISSPDGTNWVLVDRAAVDPYSILTGLAYGNGMYVRTIAGSGLNRVRVSKNATDWTTTTNINATYYSASLAFGNGVFVAVDGQTAFRSSDGTNWVGTAMPGFPGKVLFINGQFWAGGSAFMTSLDGESWSVLYNGSGTNFNNFAYANGKWVAVITFGVTIGAGNYPAYGVATSSDGSDWTVAFTEMPFFSGPPPFTSLSAVGYGAGRFVVLGTEADYSAGIFSGVLWTSTDAINWTRSTIAFPERPSDVIWTGDRFIATGTYGAIAVSPDGLTWTPLNDGNSRNFRNVSFINNQFIACGNGGLILHSDDGVGWTRAANVGTDKNVRDVVYQNGLYVATAGNGKMLTSYDGETWALHTTPRSIDVFGLTYAQGQFVAVGGERAGVEYTPYIMTSTDGTNWVDRTAGLDNQSCRLHDVAFGNGIFAAVGEPAKVVTSSDGLAWHSIDTGGTDYLKSIAYGNGRFVAVGESTNSYVSTDGTRWDRYDGSRSGGGAIYGLNSVTFAEGLFVAAGESGRVWISANGVYWSQKPSIAAADLRGIAYGNGTFVAVGNNNTILQTLLRPQLRIHRAGADYQLELTADPMRSYRMQSTDLLPGTTWTDVVTNYQTSWTTNITVPSGPAGAVFYQAVFP